MASTPAHSTPAQTLLNLAPLPESMTSVNEEAQAAQSTSTSPEPKHVPAISIEELTSTLKEQNKMIEKLVQDNMLLRDDLQRVENTIPKLAVELKTEFENMLEKTEDRIQGPIDRLLEELGRIRAAAPTPVHVSSIKTSPHVTPSVPDSRAEGEGSGGAPGSHTYSHPYPQSHEDSTPPPSSSIPTPPSAPSRHWATPRKSLNRAPRS